MHSTPFSEENIRLQAANDGVTHFCAGIAVARDGKVLVVRRVANDYLGGIYELPGGGVDDGETITEGAIRELKEETGLTVTNILGTFDGFDYSTNRKPLVRQINFLVEVEAGEPRLEPEEHDEYQWVDEHTISDTINTTDEMHACIMTALRIVHS